MGPVQHRFAARMTAYTLHPRGFASNATMRRIAPRYLACRARRAQHRGGVE